MRTLWLLAALAACKDTPKDETDGTTAGTDSADADADTDADTDADCDTTVTATDPAADATDVYYRGQIEVSFSDDGSGAAIDLLDSTGTSIGATPTWSEGNVQAFLNPVLDPSSSYTLHVSVCGTTTDVPFTTSELGSALSIDPVDLTDRTYVFRLSDADITEPAFLDVVASQYLSVPLLFGVTASDAETIDMLGALGYHEDDGTYTQIMGQATWDFPAADFTAAPYFSASADEIVITYGTIDIPVEGFTLAGTFTADGTQIQKGTATGLADSRNMGDLVNQPDDPNAICSVAAAAGVDCIPCGDGQPYFLYVQAEKITAYWEQGLVIAPVP